MNIIMFIIGAIIFVVFLLSDVSEVKTMKKLVKKIMDTMLDINLKKMK